MTKLLVVCLMFLLPGAAWSAFDHQSWDILLKRHVVLSHGGVASSVRYGELAKDREALRGYIATLSRVTQAEFQAWPKAEQLSFLINAYNALTVELVLTEYRGIESIKDIGGPFRSPWRRKFFVLLGSERHLDNLEHDLIRAEGAYNEPRIHFAVVCASIGCPGLRNEAFTGERLDAQLEDSTRKFLSDRSRNRLDRAARTLEVSKMFQWYEKDFARGWKGYRSVAQFLADYAEQLADAPADRRTIAERKAAIRFLDYDWKLNDAK